MAKLEKIFTALLGIGVLLLLLHLDGGAIITLIGGFLLSVLYWPLGFVVLNGVRGRELFRRSSYSGFTLAQVLLSVLLGVFLSAGIVASLFCLLHYAGADALRLISVVGLLGVLGLVFAFRAKLPAAGRPWLLRGALVLGLLGLTYGLPTGPAAPPVAVTVEQGR